MARKSEIRIDEVFTTTGTPQVPLIQKRFMEILPRLNRIRWKKLTRVEQLDIGNLDVTNYISLSQTPGGFFLFILKKEDLARLPKTWVHTTVYSLGHTVILVNGNQLELYNQGLGVDPDHATLYTDGQNGNTFSKVELFPA